MKKNLTFLFLIFLGVNISFGQHFTTPATDTIFHGEVTDADFAAKFIIVNDSSASFPMTWEVEFEDIETGWEYSLCDPVECHPVGATTASFSLPTSSINRIMNIHYFPNDNYGQSTVSVKLWENDFPTEYVILTWTGVVSALGVNDNSNYSVSTLFSKENNSILFNYEISLNEQHFVDLFDLSGKLISTAAISDEAGQISIGANLNAGIYFYNLRTADAQILSNKVVIP